MFFMIGFFIAPIEYSFWYNTLRPMVIPNSYSVNLLFAGDTIATEFNILMYLIAGIIIAWGFAVAARKGTSEQETEYQA